MLCGMSEPVFVWILDVSGIQAFGFWIPTVWLVLSKRSHQKLRVAFIIFKKRKKIPISYGGGLGEFFSEDKGPATYEHFEKNY